MKILRRKKLKTQQKKTKEENKNGIKHTWPKETCVGFRDSIVAGIDMRKMSSKRLMKVRTFPGATSSDMYHYLVPILEKKPDHVTLHVGRTVARYEETEIVDKLLELKSFIIKQLPTTYIVISDPVTRTDSKHLAMEVADIQSHLLQIANQLDW